MGTVGQCVGRIILVFGLSRLLKPFRISGADTEVS
jgi:hypothetical protein